MLMHFGNEKFFLINDILSKIDISKLNETEIELFEEFRTDINNTAKKRKEYIANYKKLDDKVNEQIETHNFEYICGVANGTTLRPRCMSLHEDNGIYYCTGYEICNSQKKNPNYKEI